MGSMTELLGRLPLAALEIPDNESLEIRLVDINRVAALRKLPRPDPAMRDETSIWFAEIDLNYTEKDGRELARFSPSHGLLAVATDNWLHLRYGFRSPPGELGFLRTGIESFATIEGSHFTMRMAVVVGDLRVSDELSTAASYLQIGSTPEGEIDMEARSDLRNLGQSLFVAETSGQVAVSGQTAHLEAWLAPDSSRLIDDPRYALIGRELDRADALGAWIFPAIDRADDTMHEIVAVGAALNDNVPTSVIIYVFTDDVLAQNAKDKIEQAWTTGPLGSTDAQLAEVFPELIVEHIGRSVVVTSPVGESWSTNTAKLMARLGDLPFAS